MAESKKELDDSNITPDLTSLSLSSPRSSKNDITPELPSLPDSVDHIEISPPLRRSPRKPKSTAPFLSWVRTQLTKRRNKLIGDETGRKSTENTCENTDTNEKEERVDESVNTKVEKQSIVTGEKKSVQSKYSSGDYNDIICVHADENEGLKNLNLDMSDHQSIDNEDKINDTSFESPKDKCNSEEASKTEISPTVYSDDVFSSPSPEFRKHVVTSGSGVKRKAPKNDDKSRTKTRRKLAMFKSGFSDDVMSDESLDGDNEITFKFTGKDRSPQSLPLGESQTLKETLPLGETPPLNEGLSMGEVSEAETSLLEGEELPSEEGTFPVKVGFPPLEDFMKQAPEFETEFDLTSSLKKCVRGCNEELSEDTLLDINPKKSRTEKLKDITHLSDSDNDLKMPNNLNKSLKLGEQDVSLRNVETKNKSVCKRKSKKHQQSIELLNDSDTENEFEVTEPPKCSNKNVQKTPQEVNRSSSVGILKYFTKSTEKPKPAPCTLQMSADEHVKRQKQLNKKNSKTFVKKTSKTGKKSKRCTTSTARKSSTSPNICTFARKDSAKNIKETITEPANDTPKSRSDFNSESEYQAYLEEEDLKLALKLQADFDLEAKFRLSSIRTKGSEDEYKFRSRSRMSNCSN